jgi:PhoPQ-activated pathogenicity-related protein
LQTIGPAYTSTILDDRGGGVYLGTVPKPEHGWTAYFVEMTFPNGEGEPFKFTTGVRVMPDELPFGPPPQTSPGTVKPTSDSGY